MATKKKTTTTPPTKKPVAKKPAAKKPVAKKPAAKKPAAPAKAATPSRAPAKKAAPKNTPPRQPAKKKVPAKRIEPAATPRAEVSPEPAVVASVASPPPEIAFAARVPPPPIERPRPERRRGIFFDVENTSRLSDVSRMLEQLRVDRVGALTELVASGNWRVIGNETARLLARHGAHLVHSAPNAGVRDWSDLRIAVSAGMWLASARPGDLLDVVSDDKAFDVIGDVAAGLGVVFVRHSYRAAQRAAATERGEAPARTRPSTRRRGGAPAAPATPAAPSTPSPRRERPPARQARPAAVKAPPKAPVEKPPEPKPLEAPTGAGPASKEQILEVVNRLLESSPKGVAVDLVAKRLKAMGYERPPGAPRLVTELRRFKDELVVTESGMIRARE